MPNWVNNTMIVTGSVPQLTRFTGQAIYVKGEKQVPFVISSFLPCPEGLTKVAYPVRIITEEQYKAQNPEDPIQGITIKKQSQLIKKYGYDNWYDWCINNWGTRSDVVNCTISAGYLSKVNRIINGESEGNITYRFDTAWNPPIEALTFISKKFPKLTFMLNYKDECGELKGTAIFFNGVVRHNERFALTAQEREELGMDDEDEEAGKIEDAENAECDEYDGEIKMEDLMKDLSVETKEILDYLN